MPGFIGKRHRENPALPSAAPTPSVALDGWELFLTTENGATRAWNWSQFRSLPSESIATDIQKPIAYICGPTSFVEAASGLLTQAGYEHSRIKTERFGPTG